MQPKRITTRKKLSGTCGLCACSGWQGVKKQRKGEWDEGAASVYMPDFKSCSTGWCLGDHPRFLIWWLSHRLIDFLLFCVQTWMKSSGDRAS